MNHFIEHALPVFRHRAFFSAFPSLFVSAHPASKFDGFYDRAHALAYESPMVFHRSPFELQTC